MCKDYMALTELICSDYGGCVHTDVTSCSASWGESSDNHLVPPPKGHYLLKELDTLVLASS